MKLKWKFYGELFRKMFKFAIDVETNEISFEKSEKLYLNEKN
jgi:hypothetical protein